MNKLRSTLLTTVTPVPSLPGLTLYHDTWIDHILKHHPEMEGKEELVKLVVSNPTVVGISPQNPDYYIFLKTDVATPTGKLLTVFADPNDAVIVTSFYNRSFTIAQVETVIWQA